MKKKYKSPRNTGEPSRRKFKGFGFYLLRTDKLSKKNRKEFLQKSRPLLEEVSHSLPLETETKMNMEMDSNLSDLELLDQWNYIYNTYGYLMDKFREKWEKEQRKGEPKFKPSQKFEHKSEFEELKQRISQLEMEVRLLKRKDSHRFNDLG